ncbi:hypothetical protein JMJ35_003922 [Cladonia borealis]|uniref:Uncharacterized protein n=1 Tax=Cladonia borealis TaxID=184061 RepID=A0AA39R299_9LECA|nr:hypothetical protein JMJ35_003922 [Cladonia borealis]
MANLPNDLQNMAESLKGLLGEREEATYYQPRRSTGSEAERSNHHRSLTGETLSEEPQSSTALSLPQAPGTESSDPVSETPTFAEPPELSEIPFQIRHRFLGWLIPILEACYLEFATANLGRPYLDAILSGKCLEDVAQIDLPLWRHIIERAVEKGILTSQAFFAYKLNRSNIFIGAEAVRHAWIHREDIAMIDLSDAKCLSQLLGDSGRKDQIQHAFDLVAAATTNTDDVDQEITDSINHLFTTREVITTQTDVFAGFQRVIERRLYHYSQQHHPDILEHKGWTMAEQGEMPRWEEAFRDIPFVFQTDFPNDTGNLLSSCLCKARGLRNDVAHRHRYGKEKFLDHVHNSIKTLLVLGDPSSAIEVEITAEAWLLGSTREKVLLRLRDEYLVDDAEGIADSSEKRREMKRRAAIAEFLRREVLPDCLNTVDENSRLDESPCSRLSLSQTRCVEEESRECTIPDQIRLTPPDTWATRRETFSSSMHPMLKVLHVPEWSMIWDYQAAKSDLEWERIFEANGDDNTSALEKGANYQHHESEEELADYDSDSTALDGEEEEEEEEGEWYDSDDTAFDHEDDDIPKSWPQSEIPTKFEPGGVWMSSEATTVGAPW